ncbi:hypothetical protein QA641_14100 [Bradyrhizobium sp. CB1650]|uniref:hypothetical protein n=1 Tax=Bradyrhizobium sp. CB1650 TaxID=3039153 RepID=UPI002434BA98|nr:hypothetical protein [Bradyrhizobium sp. CB1650]WGD54942.1 hypothetical protein QA641_14100 [Bradyrhizobium sp. CB1650]
MNLTVSRREFLVTLTALLTMPPRLLASPAGSTGTFEHPFSPQSLWNARPVDPVLGKTAIPRRDNVAWLEQDKYAAKLFRATASDGPMTVQGRDAVEGIWVADELRNRPVIVPHFPENVVPATGLDGHCEILDESTGFIHSFYQLSFDTAEKVWKAGKYTASSVSGTGWGSPARPDGPRASGTPSTSGILRAHEIGSAIVPHALAVAAHTNALKSGPLYPSTLQDSTGTEEYSGSFPMGTLFMLPPDFDFETLNLPNARAIARTLKVYGARLTDTAFRTFSFAGEIGGQWSQAVDGNSVWRSSWADDLDRIRDHLRPVISTSSWLDSEGLTFTPPPWERMNLLSMRGPWTKQEGPEESVSGFETTSNLFLFPETQSPIAYNQTIHRRDNAGRDPWFQWTQGCWYTNPEPGRQYRVKAAGFGQATAGLDVRARDETTMLTSVWDLKAGETAEITWPARASVTKIFVRTPPGPPSGIRLELQAV